MMESALEVLSRAATMVNTNSDTRLSINKELPTTKWRRDRRVRLSSEYHHNHNESLGAVKPLGESNQPNSLSDSSNMEIPLDMTIGASKPSPPPPYRDPLPGSTFCTLSRPSVITQAPKREIIFNQENKQCIQAPAAICDDINPSTESISMVDPVIDEHFRRSLGADYKNLFGKRLDQLKSPTSSATKPTRKTQLAEIESIVTNDTKLLTKETLEDKKFAATKKRDNKEIVENIEMSVDDHFAKALGDTWKQLQQSKSNTSSIESEHENDVNCNSVIDTNIENPRQMMSKVMLNVQNTDPASPTHR